MTISAKRTAPADEHNVDVDSKRTKVGYSAPLLPPPKSIPWYMQETFKTLDPVHGFIQLPLICKSFIDHRIFQRMRSIRQLAMSPYVFPGATHDRFLHSIGTGLLAYEMMKTIRSHQPELEVTDADVLVVTIAGLCHDLGHPCFSHMFEVFVHDLGRGRRKQLESQMNECAPEKPTKEQWEELQKARRLEKWTHEEASVQLLRALIDDIRPDLIKAELSDRDLTCIEELIEPPKKALENLYENKELGSRWGEFVKGRPLEKAWMYEIVSNWRSGLDVDKFDYFRRDAFFLGIRREFDHWRYMKTVRVVEDPVQHVTTLSPPDKDKDGIRENVLELRRSLHRTAYQHKTTKKFEMHMVKILKLLDPHLELIGTGGKKMKMSDAADQLDVQAFMQLTDSFIVSMLMGRHVPEAALQACDEYERVFCKRDLMRLVGDWDLPRELTRAFDVDEIADGVRESYAFSEEAIPGESLHPLAKDELRVVLVDLHHGMKTSDPIRRVLFHSTKGPHMDFFLHEDHFKPMRRKIFVFLHEDPPVDKDRQILKLRRLSWAFEQWAGEEENIEVRRQCLENTPEKKGYTKEEVNHDSPVFTPDREEDTEEETKSTPEKKAREGLITPPRQEEKGDTVKPKRVLKINHSVDPHDAPTLCANEGASVQRLRTV